MGTKLLITGGTGSFGQKFVEVALRENRYDIIRIYSRSEFLQSEMAKRFNDSRLRFLIGDVRDRNRLYRAMYDIDIVVHAAALKQIPTAEYNPSETSKTNIDGAINVIDAAIDTGVEKVLALSTDKACSPCNLYGATKLVAEKLFIQANVYAGAKNTRFSCVRYGNVLGSRGSIIPLFLKQKEEGELTITDERMTRFWISLEQGVHFVMDRLENMQGGEVFVPKIPSMKITDIADAIAPDAKIKFMGIRAGEKIHEVLITEEESRHTVEFEDYLVILPEYPFGFAPKLKIGGTPTKIVKYASDSNEWWMTKEEFKDILRQMA